MNFRNVLVKVHWLLASQFGIDTRYVLRSFRGLPRYLRDLRRFRREYSGALTLLPCLHDWYHEGGMTKGEYFWQDLLVAKMIFKANPLRHVDVGSRVDGFVSHVASFREIEVFDVRPITSKVPGVVFRQADVMQPITSDLAYVRYCDSLSCLHAIEHFGLGRYGDPIDPAGYERGIYNMVQMLQPGGRLYLSTPIGRERVEFNANRVFDPRVIIRCAKTNGLQLEELTVIGVGGTYQHVQLSEDKFFELAQSHYNLGIFVFSKTVR